ncbi:MAG: Sodium/glucose cotransporter [Gemmatimonadaceae bacterium]|nr:Sodium/glucose cotransporter [Gemmatimonadaceae bacterium]
MPIALILLLGYSGLLIAVGLWIGRRVRSSDSFFVAGRTLGPGLLFSTVLAANIGAGSTVGAAGLGYHDGLAAWWWVGAAAAGSLVQALWVGPRMRRIAAERGLRTVGDYLEFRFSRRLRVIVAVLLWIGTLAILAGQLIALSTVVTAVAGLPKWVGCLLGGAVMTLYFTAGGLLSSAWVNMLQLTVLLGGFAIALPAAFGQVGGWSGVVSGAPADAAYFSIWSNGASGWSYLFLLMPAFIVSPGLLQKVFGARDDRAVRFGVGMNAIVLFGFAFIPPLLGMIARSLHPSLESAQLALPTLLAQDVPVAIGALGLAALFSAEVSTADAILFMLATSLSQDLYKQYVRRDADDRQVLHVARIAAAAGGAGGIAIALIAQTIVGTLSFFYSVLGVCLFVPILGGLYVARFRERQAMASILAGIGVMLVIQLATGGMGFGGLTPTALGLLASVMAGAVALMTSPSPFRESRHA